MIARLTESDYVLDRDAGSVWIEAAGYVVRILVTRQNELRVSTFINGNEEGDPLSDVVLPSMDV